VAEESRQFYLDQLKARLEYYRELGIDGLKVQKRGPTESLESSQAQTHIADPPPSSQFMTSKTPYPESKERSGEIRETGPSLFTLSSLSAGKQETLEEIRTDLGDCKRCKLCSTRTNIVFGSGDSKARLVFVGEGPGADEDLEGLPFVGRAGQLLTKIIEAIRLTRDQVYICNVVKCRPPNNRFPEPDEVAACSPFLLRQLESIHPDVICCLGAAAAQTILQTKASIGRLRGRFHDCLGTKVMPTFHPSYLLRNPDAKRDVWEDMKKVRALLDESSSGPES
jgi:uracil-DNA glycosylase family 4